MAKNKDAGDAGRTPDSPTGGGPVTAPDPRAKPTEVEAGAPRTLPPLAPPGRIASADINPADRTRVGDPGTSAQVNSGAALPEQLFGREEDDEDDDEDNGPKLVVLHTFVNGPGGGPYIRGKVITVRDLLGHNMLKDENRRVARRHLRRYLEEQGGVPPSVRLATSEEAEHDFVTFPEGEVALTSALDDANLRADEQKARADALEEELNRLRGEQGDTTRAGENVDVDSLLNDAQGAEGAGGTKEGSDDF